MSIADYPGLINSELIDGNADQQSHAQDESTYVTQSLLKTEEEAFDTMACDYDFHPNLENLFPIVDPNDPAPIQWHIPFKNDILMKENSISKPEVKGLLCPICGKLFRHQYTLTRHLPAHTHQRNFKCDICGKAFRQMSTLSQHKAIHIDARPHTCNICQKSFNRVSTLISHRKIHTGVKPHKCPYCEKAFHQKGNLRNHIYTHTNERPYKCLLCDKGFNQMSNLMCHKNHAHIENGNLKCATCQLPFNRQRDLDLHEGTCGRTKTWDISPAWQIIRPTAEHNVIEVDVISTPFEALRRGLEPFVLLKAYDGKEALVKIMPSGNGKHLLVPPTPKELESVCRFINCNNGSQITMKFPVVATINQVYDEAGRLHCKVDHIFANGLEFEEIYDSSSTLSSITNNHQ